MILANVVFPAPTAAYLVSLFLPVVGLPALVAEFIVFARFQRGVTRWPILAAVVVGVNVLSWIVGFFVSCFLPAGLVPRFRSGGSHGIPILAPGPAWGEMAIASFFWACFLSFAIEYGVLRCVRRWIPFRKLALCTGLANIASYTVIAVAMTIFFQADLF